MLKDGMQRKLRLGCLLDFYGGFLTERQQSFLDLHENQDYSLLEIAEQEGISRQGVHDAIRRGEATLLEMEDRLGLIGKFSEITASLNFLKQEILDWQPLDQNDQRRKENWSASIDALLATWD